MFGEICSCGCHNNKNIRHVISCCVTCPSCDGRIKTSFYDNHVKKCIEECEARLKELISKYKKLD
jgi:hypothetical protein